jgi:hypothetical protein
MTPTKLWKQPFVLQQSIDKIFSKERKLLQTELAVNCIFNAANLLWQYAFLLIEKYGSS